MFPKRTLGRQKFLTRKLQRGFLIPLSLFIVIAMGLLALALTRTTTQTGLATAQELMSVQALYAAESGAQASMQQLFYDSAFVEYAFDDVNTVCATMAVSLVFDGVPGLANCRAVVSCECATCADPQAVIGVYTLQSAGTCGSGLTSATRVIRVGTSLSKQ